MCIRDRSTLKHKGRTKCFSPKIALSLVLPCLAASLLIGRPAAVFAIAYDSHTQVSPATATIAPGATLSLTATIQPGCLPPKSCPPITGTLIWDDGDAGGSFSVPTCTFLSSDNLSTGRCTTTYTGPNVPGLAAVLATYSGSAAYSSSAGSSSVEVVIPGSSSTTSTTSTSSSSITGSVGAAGPGFVELAALVGIVAVVALALVALLIVKKPKSPKLPK